MLRSSASARQHLERSALHESDAHHLGGDLVHRLTALDEHHAALIGGSNPPAGTVPRHREPGREQQQQRQRVA